MKICVSGVHGTGKSFKVLELAQQYKLNNKNKKIGIIQENIINCPFEINKKTTALSQYWIICHQITKEIEYSKKYDITITDRSIFDPICYSIAVGLQKESEVYYNFTKYLGNTYDRIILIDGNNFNYCFDDGLRDTDIEFRNNVNNIFIKLFHQLYDEKWINNLEIIN